MIALMEKFNTYFGLELAFLIFRITEQLSVTLQNIDTNANDCYVAVNITIRVLNSLRTDEKFKSFYDLAKKNADGKCNPPILPRQRDIPQRINDGEPQNRLKSVEDMYRKEYFDIDSTIGGLERRFMQPHFDIVRNIEAVLMDSANWKAATLTNEFVSLYAKDIDMKKLNL